MSEQMRKGFEDWAEKHGYVLKVIAQQDGLGTEIYANGQTRSAWLGWQASRQSLVVKLPQAYDDNQIYFKDDIQKSLDTAGVRYE